MWKMQCHLPPPHSCSPPPQALDLILDATPFPFSLELAAAAASRSDLLSLDKWLMDHLARDDGPAFLLALLRFLDAKTQVCVGGEEGGGRGEGGRQSLPHPRDTVEGKVDDGHRYLSSYVFLSSNFPFPLSSPSPYTHTVPLSRSAWTAPLLRPCCPCPSHHPFPCSFLSFFLPCPPPLRSAWMAPQQWRSCPCPRRLCAPCCGCCNRAWLQGLYPR